MIFSAAYLLDQTTDITKFAPAKLPEKEKSDLDLAMSDILTMANITTTDSEELEKYRKEVENWTRLRFKWKRTNTKLTAFPLSPSSFWMMHGGN
ncbi:Constitutive coactivator of PPAR-gamma-like protein 2 [Phytophthora palmivora]|uniref:Constitutive coactivator of PPAR-gamma-like protein 2 n=1 Tax=Phytophthora palmivora TaxID=4796 RepID=A0A2P4X4G8_9STRA|nr:Constitutive coactivator of PPAR-gamma-like protein 2 [Phytophthora palmivora]